MRKTMHMTRVQNLVNYVQHITTQNVQQQQPRLLIFLVINRTVLVLYLL